MSFAIRSSHCGRRWITKLDERESDGLNCPPVLEAVVGRGATFLLLLSVVGGGLLCGCSKSTSNNNPNEQAPAEANPGNASGEQQAHVAAEQKKLGESLNHLKQIALAFHNYHDTYKTFPAAVQIGPKDVPHSWRVTLLPFLEGMPVYDRYRQDEPWDSEHNKTLLAEMPAVFRAPSDAANSSNTSYFGFAPANASNDPRVAGLPALGGTLATRLRDITDGTSNTVLVVESKVDVPWTQPTDLPFDPTQPLPKMGGIHADGFCVAMCDGSSTFIPDSYDRDMLLNLIVRNDGKVVELPGAKERERAVAEARQKQQAENKRAIQKLATSEDPVDRREASLANLKQIALAMHNYHDTYKTLPAAIQIGPKKVPHSWRVTILPFIEQGDLFTRYRQDEPWDSPHNKTLLAEMPDVYRAPGVAATSTNSSYFGFTLTSPTESDRSPLPALAGSRNTAFRDITDGTSNSLLVVESKREVPWTQPTDIPFDVGQPLPAMGGIHGGGFFAALCDGSVRFFPDSFDRSMLLKIILRSDGQPVALP